MNEDLHFWIAVVVFGLMAVGLVLTAVEFRRMSRDGDDNGDR